MTNFCRVAAAASRFQEVLPVMERLRALEEQVEEEPVGRAGGSRGGTGRQDAPVAGKKQKSSSSSSSSSKKR